jgi:hypothetical protein
MAPIMPAPQLAHLLAVVGVHPDQALDVLEPALGGVEDGVTGAKGAGVDPDEGHAGAGQAAAMALAAVDLERQRGQRGRGIGGTLGGDRRRGGAGAGGATGDLTGRDHAAHRRDLEGRRQEVDDTVEQVVHTLVAEGGAEQHGDDRAPQGGAA